MSPCPTRSDSGARTARSSSGVSTADVGDCRAASAIGVDIVREVNLPPQALQQLAARFPAHYPMLFDSAAPGPLGQQTILVTQPRAALWSDSNGKVASSGFKHVGEDFLTALENWWRAERSGPRGASAPFAGGWVLFLGYETAQNIEPR